MHLPLAHYHSESFQHLNMSPLQENLGRRPNVILPMLNPKPYGIYRTPRPSVPPPLCPEINSGTNGGYGTYRTPRPTVPPPHCPMLVGGPHGSYGTYRSPRPSVPPPPTPPLSHDVRSIDAIVIAFINHPRPIMRMTNEKEAIAYAEAYKERFRNGLKWSHCDDFPAPASLLEKVAIWIVASNFGICVELRRN